MITKTYKANTHISINVVLPSKKNLHLPFVPLSNGSSVFTTSDEELQNAIEHHYKFGDLFRCVETFGSKDGVQQAPNKENNLGAESSSAEKQDGENASEPEADGAEEKTTIKVKVSDINEAKDYLAEKYGISRTSMRSTKSIIAAAENLGIEFEGF